MFLAPRPAESGVSAGLYSFSGTPCLLETPAWRTSPGRSSTEFEPDARKPTCCRSVKEKRFGAIIRGTHGMRRPSRGNSRPGVPIAGAALFATQIWMYIIRPVKLAVFIPGPARRNTCAGLPPQTYNTTIPLSGFRFRTFARHPQTSSCLPSVPPSVPQAQTGRSAWGIWSRSV